MAHMCIFCESALQLLDMLATDRTQGGLPFKSNRCHKSPPPPAPCPQSSAHILLFAFMQNPVASTAWLAAQFMLFSPLVTLTINTRGFCKPAWRTKPFLVICIMSVALSFTANLVKPNQQLDSHGLTLYNFPDSFRWPFTGIAAACVNAYTVWMGITLVLLKKCQQHRTHPQ